MTYSFDPELAPLAAVMPPANFDDPAAARAGMRAMFAQMPAYQPPRPLTVEDHSAPGPDGAPAVPVRVYAPADRKDLLAGLLYLHGGGFVAGDLDTVHATAAQIAAEVGVVVVSVGFRLAPEHPFPAALEDCHATLVWAANKASDLGVDTDHLAVGGESSGGNLAAGLTLLVRDRGGPGLCFQYLGSPCLDDRLDTASARAFVDTPLSRRSAVAASWRHYLGDTTPGSADVSPYAAPARAEDLSGLPAAYVSTCEFDPLRDEGIGYAQRLLQAGVSTELHQYPGTFHGSSLLVQAAVARRMVADKLDALRRGLGAAPA